MSVEKNIADAIKYLTDKGLFAKRIETRYLNIKGMHVSAKHVVDDDAGEILVGGNIVAITWDSQGRNWKAESYSENKVLKQSLELAPVIDAVCEFYGC